MKMKMMDMKEPEPPRTERMKPKLWFTNCFVRGTGDLVKDPSGRPFDLYANQLLVALSGSFCNVEVAASAAPTAPPSVLELVRTTTFLGGPLLQLQSTTVTDVDKLPAYQIVTRRGACSCRRRFRIDRALIHFATKDISEMDELNRKLKRRFQWEAGKINAFGEFEPFLKHIQAGDSTAESIFDLKTEEWKKWVDTSSDSKFHVVLADPATPFVKLVPTQLRPADPIDIGADPSTLPKR